MITRIYLSKWQLRYETEGDEDSRFIWHPLLDPVDDIPAGAPGTPRDQRARVSFELPAYLPDGTPSKPSLLVIATALSIPDSWALLPDVYMFPPYLLQHKIDDIDDETKAAVIASLADYGVPYADIAGADDVAEFIDKIEDSLLSVSKSTAERFGHRPGDFE